MNTEIQIPDQMVKYILFQRTSYAKYARNKLFLIFNKYSPISFYEKILDIGCGAAGIDVFLHRHYGLPDRLDFYLLDKSTIDKKVYYNYEPKGSFYNSLELARDFLCRNGLSERRIHLIEATAENTIDAPAGIDFVISLISWGFHYPVDTYLDRVYKLMRDGGHLIIDLRPGTGGEELLKGKFRQIRKISDFKKTCRILAVK